MCVRVFICVKHFEFKRHQSCMNESDECWERVFFCTMFHSIWYCCVPYVPLLGVCVWVFIEIVAILAHVVELIRANNKQTWTICTYPLPPSVSPNLSIYLFHICAKLFQLHIVCSGYTLMSWIHVYTLVLIHECVFANVHFDNPKLICKQWGLERLTER